MWILAILALVAVAGLVRSMFVELAPEPMEIAAQGAVALVAGGLFLFFRVQRQRDAPLLVWLQENAEPLLAGETLAYQSRQVSLATRLRTHEATISLILISLKLPSRHYIGDESGLTTATLCTLTSLIFGWWGIPWGPIWTLQTVVRNLRGGKTVTVGELFAQITDDASESE